jgi:NADPH-dependent 2,4-dienoyl-CoA reductase/sulfur reductase-like enzyme/nitrite reductase/ring-hydroxylating ferredoxin subunit
MDNAESAPAGPDLTLGVPAGSLADGALVAGHVGAEAVLLARRGDEFFAVGATCSHYHAPLAEGLVVGDTVRCPWHHACFSLRTGEAVHAPAFSPLACWPTEVRSGAVFVREPAASRAPVRVAPASGAPARIVIVGGGAAGFAAAEMLRRQGYGGSLLMLSDDAAAPVDRPNLSKDYLAGTAPEDWLPLREAGYYRDEGIDLRLRTAVTGIDVAAREVELDDGSRLGYDRLLLATGAEALRLDIPGMDLPHVHTLRTLADCRAIVAQAQSARRAVVMGASFIGLEVAAALRARQVEVHVVAPDALPMARVLGPQLGQFVRQLHEDHGVVFHLQQRATAIDARQVVLDGGGTIAADLVVVGVGVRPRLDLASRAGLAIDRGVVVDAMLQTSVPGIYAAGDIARWPDPRSGMPIRVEHWVVAQRQGQTAALNMLGGQVSFDAVPFFWSQHYDVPVNYVGHAESWDEIALDGDIAGRDCLLRFKRQGRVLAVASIYRDLASLMTEVELELAPT